MFFEASVKFNTRAAVLLCCLLNYIAPYAAPAGPTLQLDYGRGQPKENSVGAFMYFVPLISPEPSTIYTNAGNSQSVRVLSFECRTNEARFHATCKFEFTGAGALQNIFDLARHLHDRESGLKDGGVVKHQLTAISVSGTGHGSVVVEGIITSNAPVANQVTIHFNRDGLTSPVTVDLKDYHWHDGTFQPENERIARVNALTFHRSDGTPTMEVTLGTIKPKNAHNNLWQNFWGGLKGMTANMFLPPLKIAPEGQQTMLDFGEAIASEKGKFTFPQAARLKGIQPGPP